MVRSLLVACAFALLVAAPAVEAETVAEQCPTYVAEVQRARASLVGGDRAGTITALRAARAALAECIRRESDNAGAPVLLASAQPAS
jgi:hypothetical protein